MRHTGRITGMILAAIGALVPTTIQAQDDPAPYNANASSPCPEVLIEQKYDHVINPRYRAMGWDTAITCAQPLIELSSEPYIPVQFFNGRYIVEEIPYNPPDTTFSLGTRVAANVDDQFAQSSISIPFPFYFFGIQKTSFILGANGCVSFSSSATASGSCPYSYTASLPWPDGTSGAPSPTAPMRDAIYGIYEDTNPQSSGAHYQTDWGIYYGIQDQFPCRKIICSWKDVIQYQCNNKHCTYQIVCYEGSNIIEVHVKQRQVCTSWINGIGTIGIQNATGTTQQCSTVPGTSNYYVGKNVGIQPSTKPYFAPSGYNTFATDLNNKSFRFTPDGATNKTYFWYRVLQDENGNDTLVPLSTDPSDTNGYYVNMDPDDPDHPTRTRTYVSPTCASRYVMQLNFMNANADWYHLNDTIHIGIDTINNLELTANTTNAHSGGVKVFSICQGETTTLPIHYTDIQQPERIDWTIKRILNGVETDLPEEMISFTANDTALTLHPDPNFAQLPRNKIDTIYVRVSVDFVSGCTNYDTMLLCTYPNFDTVEYHGICRGQTFHWEANGQDYTQTTSSPVVHKTSQPGCDSAVHLNLTVFDVSHTVDQISDCKPITWLNGKTYSTTNSATSASDTIVLQNRYGCDSVVQLDFTLHPLTARLSSSLEHFDYDHLDVELTDISTGGNARVWHFPTGVDQTAATAYYSIPVNLDEADIRLVAYSPYGCIDSTHIVIPFNKETFWVPNAFTPDDPSGNNTFGSVSTKTVQQEMLIYNRYGELVYRCSGTDCSWDGRDLDGNLCPQGAYAYIIRYTNEFEPRNTQIKKGTVTLIR